MLHRFIEAWRRLLMSVRRLRLERDLDDEVAFHLAMREADAMAAGASPLGARRDARRRFGNTTLLKERMRDMWTFPAVGSIVQDARHAIRALIREPGFGILTIAVLASVTGLNASLFTFFTALTCHAPSGIRQASSVVSLYPKVPAAQPPVFSIGEYRFLAERAKSLRVVASAPGITVELGERGASGSAKTLIVSGNFFDTLEIPIERGRSFQADEDRSTRPMAVAVIGARLWESRFNADPTILGRPILVNGIPFTIVGIASREFVGLEPAVGGRPEVFLPIASRQLLHGGVSSGIGFAHIVARLQSGATRQQAAAEADLLLRQFHEREGSEARQVIVTGTAFLSQPGRSVIFVVLAMIEVALLLVWVLACANIGNLQLARAAARGQEIAIRLSLGASRPRIVRQLLTEGFVLALTAGVLSLGIAYVLPPLLVRLVGDREALDALNFSLAPDRLVLGLALLLAAASSVGFGLAPALHATRSEVATVLKNARSQPASRVPLRAAFLAVQVAVSVIVLVGAGLLIRRVQQQSMFDPGIPVNEISVVTVSSPDGPYDGARRYGFVTELTQSLRQLPIGGFGFTTLEPFFPGGPPTEIRIPGEPLTRAHGVTFAGVSPGYFQAIGLGIVEGRDFDAGDVHGPVVVINEAMAHRHWPHQDPIGRTFVLGGSGTVEIIGIVANLSSGLEPSGPMVFRPFNASTPSGLKSIGPNGQMVEDGSGPIPFLIIRGGTQGSTDAIVAAVAQIDRRLRLKVTSLSETLEELRRDFRVGPLLAGLLGVFALALATVGMFGVFAYAVRQRTREIGIRMALGAQPADVVRLIVGGHSSAVVVGLIVGLAGAVATSLAMRSFLYQVSPFDPLAYLGVAALLTCAGLGASYVPARRATRIDPIAALRCD
jgi:predicted permease